uniref:Malectin n=1 Tax=Brachionus plicatilis TaxID=10195 RepID=A0A2L0HIJ7_BRAPC|nr:malectin [Brachionus plicatilis]
MLFLVFFCGLFSQISCLGEIIYALNAGGDSFTDINGIRYRRDYLTDGVASDYGRSLDIKRVSGQDKILYQTERYSSETFSYSISIPSTDAEYVLWLKFSEVWFNAPNLKVFDVALNDAIVVKDLDIFANVGRGVAHDEIIPFQVRKNKLIVEGKSYPFTGEIKVEFIKGDLDNPKVNAIIVMKGTPDQVPKLPPYEPEQQEEDDDELESELDESFDNEEESEQINARRQMRQVQEEQETIKKPSKKKVYEFDEEVEDPYAKDESSYLIPILVTLGAFIPILFCLCKLK